MGRGRRPPRSTSRPARAEPKPAASSPTAVQNSDWRVAFTFGGMKLTGSVTTPKAPVPLPAQPTSEAAAERPARIGRYLVAEQLGEGGQGTVYRVLHPELGKDFVLKLARQSLAAGPAGRERLLREGRLLAQCDHPGLVRVVDLDVHEGRPFVVMEHVQGRTLQRYAEQRRPGPREAARLVAKVAQAVAYLHARGIIHQDIKPSNVLVDQQGHPRLIDLGLARLQTAWSDDAGGWIGGTDAYMSPEQALGRADRIGFRTDVFGLGGLLYYLMTGRPLYRGPSRWSVLCQARTAEYVPLRQVNGRVPRSLEQICHKALAADPERRYRGADDLERAIQSFSRRPRIVAAEAVVLGLAALAIVAPWSRPDRTEQPIGPATVPPAASPLGPAITLRIVSFKIDHFRGAKPPRSLGPIGESPGPILFDDDVRVHARLNAPAYCYLIALNPDGKVQLCHPLKPTEAPLRADEIAYPGGNLYFPLTDGTGLQAFVLLVSSEPLPPYSEWTGRDKLHWETVQAEGSGVWGFDGHNFEPLAGDRRGEPRKHSGPPRPFEEVCDRFTKLPQVNAVEAVAFPVSKPSE